MNSLEFTHRHMRACARALISSHVRDIVGCNLTMKVYVCVCTQSCQLSRAQSRHHQWYTALSWAALQPLHADRLVKALLSARPAMQPAYIYDLHAFCDEDTQVRMCVCGMHLPCITLYACNASLAVAKVT